MDSQFFTDILEQNKDAVKKQVIDTMMQSIQRQFQWELPESIKKEVSAFIDAEVLPAVRAELIANKATFVEAATELARTAPLEIAKAMQASAAKNLTQSWTLRNVVGELFK